MDESQPKVPFERTVKRTTWTRTDAATGEAVHVKRYQAEGLWGRVRDRRRVALERATLERLRALGLAVPRPIAVREGADGVDLETAAVPGAVTLRAAIRGDAPFPRGPERGARALGRALADVIAAGVTLPDLHGENVLFDAAGAVWFVDVRGATVRTGPLSAEASARLLVVLSADLRETATDRWRARAWLACVRELEARGVRASQARDTREAQADISARADVCARRAPEARRLELASRARRRDVIERSSRRWLRASGATRPFAIEGHSGFAPRSVSDAQLARALAASSTARRATEFGGDFEVVARAWRDLARLVEHGIPAHAPLAFATTPRAILFFDPAGRTAALETLARADRRTRARAARELGSLLGTAFDRGLRFAGDLASAIGFDEAGRAAVMAGARLATGNLEDARDVLAAVELAVRTAAGAEPPVSRAERARFVVAFARAARAAPRSFVERSAPAGHTLRPPARREKLRRVLRARLLSGLARTSAFVPHPLVRSALTSLAPLASWSRFEAQTRANLELALGRELSRERRDAIARDVRRFAARQFSEWLRLSHAAPPDAPDAARGAWIEDLVELDPSVAALEAELARGRGALVVTAHLGNWELLAARLRRAGHPGVVVGYRRPNDSSAAWLEAMRRAYGVETLPQHENPRAILRALERGAVVGLLADLEVRRLDGVFLPFFGVDALTMTAPAALARASRSPLWPAKCVFDAARGRYRVSFEAPLALDPALERRAAVVDLARRLNGVFEGWVRAHPEQWAWHQPRWRTRPGTFRARPLAAARAGAPQPASLQRPDERLAGD